jgi:hypothetical protein
MPIKIRLGEAARFLERLDQDDSSFTFQTFDDDKDRRDKKLAIVRHGSLRQHAKELSSYVQKGAGVYVTVNRTDLAGRAAGNVERIRAVFVDLDGSPLEPTLASAKFPPHMVVCSSPGKWHVYWLVEDMALDKFTPVQKMLIGRFAGDPTVHDPSRVMRLPGFPNQKDQNNPVQVTIERLTDAAPYPGSVFRPPPSDSPTGLAGRVGEVITSPGRHGALASVARTLSARGVCYDAIIACLKVMNQMQCSPPLSGGRWREVEDVAKWATRQPVLSPLKEPEFDADDLEMQRLTSILVARLSKKGAK